jgi:type I restriction enzyme R subunit
LLRGHPSYSKLQKQIIEIASLLEANSTVPAISLHLNLIQELQTQVWWENVNVVMLENVRKSLRSIVNLIDKRERKIVYTNFQDEIGDEEVIDLGVFNSGDNFERFKAKARAFLLEHQSNITIHKLRTNQPLTSGDILALEKILIESKAGNEQDIAKAKSESNGLGIFVRSLVGLDRHAAKEAFSQFLMEKNLVGNQIQFIDLIINHLIEHGIMSPARLYESPFIDISSHGPEGIFESKKVDALVSVLEDITKRAVA